MIHVSSLQDENAAELFLRFRIGTVGGCQFAVLPRQGQGGFGTLKRFPTAPVPFGAKIVVVVKACVEHGVSFGLSHGIKFAFVVVPQTDVFHRSSLPSSCNEPAAERCAGSLISSLRRVFRGRNDLVVYLFPPGP